MVIARVRGMPRALELVLTLGIGCVVRARAKVRAKVRV